MKSLDKAFEAGVAEGKKEEYERGFEDARKETRLLQKIIINDGNKLNLCKSCGKMANHKTENCPIVVATYKQQLIGRWNKRIEEVKQGLDEEYGKGHNYTPNYEGIFIDLIQE